MRRGRRVVRRIDAWTVLKFSVLFYLSMLLVFVVAGLLLWIVASITGVVGNIEQFIKELFALESFQFVGFDILRATVLGGLVMVLLGTGLNVLGTVLYNLISDVVGGIEISVLEEEQPRRPVV